MKVIIEVEELDQSENYLLKDNKYTILIPKKFCEIIEDKKDNRDCNKCIHYVNYKWDNECITCTSKDSNFELKEKKMNDIRLTEDKALDFLNLIMPTGVNREKNIDDAFQVMKKEGWIIKDKIETAIEELKEYYDKSSQKSCPCSTCDDFRKLFSLSNKVIELLQNKIKEIGNK